MCCQALVAGFSQECLGARADLVDAATAVIGDAAMKSQHEAGPYQGLTLVHFSARLEPFLTHNTP